MDGESQQHQKTMVAFIAGLLIGGLLVWVFSASPRGDDTENNNDTETPTRVETENTNTPTIIDTDNDGDEEVAQPTPVTPAPAQGGGRLTVANQPAGATVALGDVTYPSTDGWIVVHDDGATIGRALGAARYSTKVGLLPKTIELLRNTEKGKSYRVIFYTENGDRVFDFDDDKPVMSGTEAVGTRFTAQ